MGPVTRVLLVDDDQAFLNSMERSLRNKYEVTTLNDPKKALELYESLGPFAVVVSDYRMSQLDGVQFLAMAKQCWPDTERILLTGYADLRTALSAVNSAKVRAILTKPCCMAQVENELREAILGYNSAMRERITFRENIRRITHKLGESELMVRTNSEKLIAIEQGVCKMLQKVLAAKDHYSYLHSVRVSELAGLLAIKLGLPQTTIYNVKIAGILHDVGEIYVPSEILNKTGPLTRDEFDLIRQHVEAGFDLLRTAELNRTVATIVCQHHEWLDGTGYPNHIKGEQILLESQIVAVSDVVEAMANNRPYRSALGIEAGLAEIKHHRGIRYDAMVVDACISLFVQDGYHFQIEEPLLAGSFP